MKYNLQPDKAMTPEEKKELLAKINSHPLGYTFDDLEEEEKLRKSVTLYAISDLDFEIINFIFCGRLSQIIRNAKFIASKVGYGKAYSIFKPCIFPYVGWTCIADMTKRPALKTSRACDIVLEKLIDACEAGDDERLKEQEAVK